MARRSFAGKRVLLTGASSGIGWYLASQLVRAGAFVIVTSRRSDRLADLRRTMGNPLKRLIAVPGDIADPVHRQMLIDTAVEEFGGLDIIINNAGIGAIGEFADASPERLRRIFEVNFFAATELTRLALPLLEKGIDPAICNVGSVLGHQAVPGKSEYCAAKFALRGWTDSLRIELKRKKIDVISISPSTTKSEFFDALIGTLPRLGSVQGWPQSAESVATRIMASLRKRKRDSILTLAGKAMVWAGRLAPRLTNRMLFDFAMPAC